MVWCFFFQKWFQLTHSRVLLVATDSWPIHRQVRLWIHDYNCKCLHSLEKFYRLFHYFKTTFIITDHTLRATHARVIKFPLTTLVR